MLGQINLKLFLMSFSFGILLVYVTHPKPKIVHKFPSPDNISTIYSSGEDDSCYKYESEEVECSAESVAQPVIDP
jgi:hypothetical protein